MLEINEKLFEIDDAIDSLIKGLLDTPEIKAYFEAKSIYEHDSELQESIQIFQRLNQDFEANKDYMSYRPEIKDLRRTLFKQKRQIDLNEKVIALRQAEVEVQKLLAYITETLASAVSKDIFVDTGLPLAPHKRHHQNGENIIERSQDV